MLSVASLREISSYMELISFLRYVCALLVGERQHDRRESYKASKKLVLFSIELGGPAYFLKKRPSYPLKNAPPFRNQSYWFFFHFFIFPSAKWKMVHHLPPVKENHYHVCPLSKIVKICIQNYQPKRPLKRNRHVLLICRWVKTSNKSNPKNKKSCLIKH